MQVHLEYGKDGLDVDVPGRHVRVIRSTFVQGLTDERESFFDAVRRPVGRPPLAESVRATDRVAVVVADSTRPLPSDRLLPWLFEALAHVPAENITILIGTGSHRANTDAELRAMLGSGVVDRYRVVNHDAHDRESTRVAGTTSDGHDVRFAKDYVEADRRIVLGFIEPHFMAGFSGGYKGVFPAVADIDSIQRYHRPSVIADAKSTWGILDGNPTQAIVRECGALLPVDLMINVTLNAHREITQYFVGDPIRAHELGCLFVKHTAMIPCEHRYPIVVTTNSGFPLDQNLYQSVKGMAAAAEVVDQDGLILSVSRCNDGFPDHGNFKRLLFEHGSPAEVLGTLLAPGFSLFDQWETQKLAMVQARAHVGLYSELDAGDVKRAHLEPVTDIAVRLGEELERRGIDGPVLVLPEGPLTVPYLDAGA
jgi:lactate racemase